MKWRLNATFITITVLHTRTIILIKIFTISFAHLSIIINFYWNKKWFFSRNDFFWSCLLLPNPFCRHMKVIASSTSPRFAINLILMRRLWKIVTRHFYFQRSLKTKTMVMIIVIAGTWFDFLHATKIGLILAFFTHATAHVTELLTSEGTDKLINLMFFN